MILDISINGADISLISLILTSGFIFLFLFKLIKMFIEKEYEEGNRFPSPPPMWETTTYYEGGSYKKYTKLPYGAYGRDIIKRKKK